MNASDERRRSLKLILEISKISKKNLKKYKKKSFEKYF